jgi:hypothetical protein
VHCGTLLDSCGGREGLNLPVVDSLVGGFFYSETILFFLINYKKSWVFRTIFLYKRHHNVFLFLTRLENKVNLFYLTTNIP